MGLPGGLQVRSQGASPTQREAGPIPTLPRTGTGSDPDPGLPAPRDRTAPVALTSLGSSLRGSAGKPPSAETPRLRTNSASRASLPAPRPALGAPGPARTLPPAAAGSRSGAPPRARPGAPGPAAAPPSPLGAHLPGWLQSPSARAEGAPARGRSLDPAASALGSQTAGPGGRAGPAPAPQEGAGSPCAASWRTRSQVPESAARMPRARGALPAAARGAPTAGAGLTARGVVAASGRSRAPPRPPARPPARAGRGLSVQPDARLSAAAAREEFGRRVSHVGTTLTPAAPPPAPSGLASTAARPAPGPAPGPSAAPRLAPRPGRAPRRPFVLQVLAT